MSDTCAVCGHPYTDHGRHQDFVDCGEDKHELCLLCPGYTVMRGDYEVDGYPNGKAWHRFRDGGKVL